MAVIKTWEAVDVKIHPNITLFLDDENFLHVNRNYQYVDTNGEVVMPREVKMHEEIRQWSNVPQDIKDALAKINNYINNAIDEKEGIVR